MYYDEEDTAEWVINFSCVLEVIHKVAKLDSRIDSYIVDILDGFINEEILGAK